MWLTSSSEGSRSLKPAFNEEQLVRIRCRLRLSESNVLPPLWCEIWRRGVASVPTFVIYWWCKITTFVPKYSRVAAKWDHHECYFGRPLEILNSGSDDRGKHEVVTPLQAATPMDCWPPQKDLACNRATARQIFSLNPVSNLTLPVLRPRSCLLMPPRRLLLP
ncbi:hypothetical protein AVEN_123469-1 [Araneus ventricosus]|uniref:Uncharacterized protein n=1 Tax=Araneus ventricosus TaxID=182803 RepID=A0A4Y2UVF7_ARAVE|nr:hypothetical protein AVEN_123469-1 [Araneus ventricosus]